MTASADLEIRPGHSESDHYCEILSFVSFQSCSHFQRSTALYLTLIFTEICFHCGYYTYISPFQVFQYAMMDADSATPRKRRRPALACEQCRRRKIRCDRNIPCDQCIRSRSKNETCTYLPDDYSASSVGSRRVDRNHRTSSPNSSSAANARTPASPTALPGTDAFDVWADQSPIEGNPTRQLPLVEGLYRGRVADSKKRVKSPNPASSVQALLDRVQQLEKKLLDSASTQPAAPVSQPTDKSDPSIKGSFSKSMFFGQSHWMNVIDQVREFSLKEQFLLEASISTASTQSLVITLQFLEIYLLVYTFILFVYKVLVLL